MDKRTGSWTADDEEAAAEADWLSASAAAARLGVSQRTIRRAIARGDLPAAKHAGAYRIAAADLARDAGLPRAPHAGETGGPRHVWAALEDLHADRIGHGVRAIEDPWLVETLLATQVPLEVCPTSNILLGVYPAPEAHPIRALWDAGIFVTVNTDDPTLFGVTLADEYRTLARRTASRATNCAPSPSTRFAPPSCPRTTKPPSSASSR